MNEELDGIIEQLNDMVVEGMASHYIKLAIENLIVAKEELEKEIKNEK